MSVAPSSTELIHVEERDNVAYISLDRPPLNVLSIALMRELMAAMEKVSQQPELRAVVLRGEGKAFSVGAEVNEVKSDKLPIVLSTFGEMIKAILRNPVPVVARVHGLALGGGCEMATAADIVVMAEDAKIGTPEIKLGVIPPAGIVLLPRLIGRHRAMEMMLGGELITGAEAVSLGLANRAVPADKLDETVEKLLASFRSASGFSLRLLRKAIIDSLDLPAVAALDRLEPIQVNDLHSSHDADEGLRAFLEKRTPTWQHR